MAKLRIATLAGLLAAVGSVAASQAPDCRKAEGKAFTVLPMLSPAGRSGRSQATYCLTNLRAETVEVRSGEGEPWPVPVKAAGVTLVASKVGNYHWLQAREQTPDRIVTASTVHYFANPGPAPSAMLQAAKAELEIVPQPLPREHWQYRAGETWAFLVRFNGRPLAETMLRLETSGGTRQVLATDIQGVVRVTFPADFKPARDDHGGGYHDREPENRFVLAVGHTDRDGHHYRSAFNYKYFQADETGKSLKIGLGFLMLGGLIGLPLALGRAKEKKHG